MPARIPLIVLAVVVAALALIGGYLLAGGGGYRVDETADPCAARPLPTPAGAASDEPAVVTQRVLLVGFDRAACRLGVGREELVLALVGSGDPLDELARASGRSRDDAEAELQAGLGEALDAAERDGALEPALADAVSEVLAVVPIRRALATLRGDVDTCEPFPWQGGQGVERTAAQIGVIAALRAACHLDLPIEDVLLAITGSQPTAELARAAGLAEDETESRLRQSADEAIGVAERAGALPGAAASALRTAAAVVELDTLFAALRGEAVCLEPTWQATDGFGEVGAQVALIGLTRAACTLGRSPLELAAALASPEALDDYLRAEGLERDQVEDALRDGLREGVDAAQQNDAVNAVTGFLLEQAVQRAPVLDVLALIEDQLERMRDAARLVRRWHASGPPGRRHGACGA